MFRNHLEVFWQNNSFDIEETGSALSRAEYYIVSLKKKKKKIRTFDSNWIEALHKSNEFNKQLVVQ